VSRGGVGSYCGMRWLMQYPERSGAGIATEALMGKTLGGEGRRGEERGGEERRRLTCWVVVGKAMYSNSPCKHYLYGKDISIPSKNPRILKNRAGLVRVNGGVN